MRNLLNANFLLHYKFDKLRNFKHKSILVGMFLAFFWFVVWVSAIAFGVLLLNNDAMYIRILGAIWLLLIFISRFCAIISESLYQRKKERKLKEI